MFEFTIQQVSWGMLKAIQHPLNSKFNNLLFPISHSLKMVFKSLTRKLLAFQQSDTKFFWILAALSLLIILGPFLPRVIFGQYLLRLLFTFLILSGIFAAKEERQIIRQVIAIGSIVLILDWIESLIQRDTSALFVIVLVLYSIFFIAIAVATLIEVLKSQRVTANIICGAIVVYLLIGLSAALLATLMDTVHLGSFLRQGEPLAREGLFHDLLYYSLVTLSTIGYGDITPNSPAAQSLSITLGLLGQIYLTVLVAMLVGKLLKE